MSEVNIASLIVLIVCILVIIIWVHPKLDILETGEYIIWYNNMDADRVFFKTGIFKNE